MRRSDLYRTKQIRPANEARFEARWQLGRLLAKIERGTGPGRGKKMSRAETSFRDYLAEINLDKARASEAGRIGTLPEPELRKDFPKQRRWTFSIQSRA
jgi:hypothetical protein